MEEFFSSYGSYFENISAAMITKEKEIGHKSSSDLQETL